MKVRHILETILYTTDLEVAETFYTQVLGLKFVDRKAGKFVFLQCGEQMLFVFNPAATSQQTHLPAHGAHGPQHVAFAVPELELDRWYQHLEAHGVAIEQDITWKNGSRSIYFRDPAGNSVELASPTIWNLPEVSDQ